VLLRQRSRRVDRLDQGLREVDDLYAGELAAPDLAISRARKQMLRRGVPDRCVEPQLPVSDLPRPVLELRKGQSGVPAALERGIHPHPLDLTTGVGDVAQGSHRDQASIAEADEELTAVLQIRGRNRVEILIPQAPSEMNSGLCQPEIVKPAHSAGVASLEPPYL
jgi:hypothetical protein